MKPLSGEYESSLASDDIFDLELPFIKSKATGGTLILWKKKLDPHITILPIMSSSFHPLLLHPPGVPPTIHIAVYLPTSGKEAEFVSELSKLSLALDDLSKAHPEASKFIRGDFNVNPKNQRRAQLLDLFCSHHRLHQVPITIPTYHHFTGEGKSDSILDRILFSAFETSFESLFDIKCSMVNPLIDSHHDLIMTKLVLQNLSEAPDKPKDNITAPKTTNTRRRVLWSEQGIENYQKLVVPHLLQLQDRWLASHSLTSISILLEATNDLLNSCAEKTNKTVPCTPDPSQKPRGSPRIVRMSQKQLLKKHKKLKTEMKNNVNINNVKEAFKRARINHRRLIRSVKANESIKRDENLYDICSKTPFSLYSSIRRSKRAKAGKINKLTVQDKVYTGDAVSDGFFDSISNLKTRDSGSLEDSMSFKAFSDDYQSILEISRHQDPIPHISEKESFELLHAMKAEVTDFFGITVNHYKYAGPAGWRHFRVLLNSLIDDVSNTIIKEVNTVHAIIIFKGHGKVRTSDRSYRTISTCPVVAKAMDLYVRNLNISRWNLDQSCTQFQGQESSHELAAILLTESIQHSLFSLKKPVYVLYLDAQSAFDVVLHELLIRKLHFCGTTGQTLMYINNRLQNRQTYIEWDGSVMGPILDQCGLEQGGVSSSDFYKIFSRDQLAMAQDSRLGAPLGNLLVSAVGIADDTALVANDIRSLKLLLHLTSIFCSKYNVKLCASKTKLQIFATNYTEFDSSFPEVENIYIDGAVVEKADFAEHVGILRSPLGNQPAIMARISAHRKAMAAVLHAGIARGHRGNPAAGLRVETTYGLPVLLSGLSALVLTKGDEDLIDRNHKEMISNIQRLLPRTPRSVIYFLGGSLPCSAFLHLRQLTNFGMISRLQKNILNEHAKNIFEFSTVTKKSWFLKIRDLCIKYDLPHPKELLSNPLTKTEFRSLIKRRVISYWETKLREEAAALDSLLYFKPCYMSLTRPHPLWYTAGSSPSKVAMASIQALMISGRYRSEALCRHWASKNKNGFCLLSPTCSETVETIQHILYYCFALQSTRDKLKLMTLKYCEEFVEIRDIAIDYLVHPTDPYLTCQVLLDCSVVPRVIRAVQHHGRRVLFHLFHITRIWIYNLHKQRMKVLGRWNFF